MIGIAVGFAVAPWPGAADEGDGMLEGTEKTGNFGVRNGVGWTEGVGCGDGLVSARDGDAIGEGDCNGDGPGTAGGGDGARCERLFGLGVGAG